MFTFTRNGNLALASHPTAAAELLFGYDQDLFALLQSKIQQMSCGVMATNNDELTPA